MNPPRRELLPWVVACVLLLGVVSAWWAYAFARRKTVPMREDFVQGPSPSHKNPAVSGSGWGASSSGAVPRIPTNSGAAPTIAVSIASYRDTECSDTVQRLIQRAAHPERVVLYIFQQNANGQDAENCVRVHHAGAGSVKVRTVPHTEAGGPTVARAAIARDMYLSAPPPGPEDFFLQLDSHEVPSARWDEMCIADWSRARAQVGHDRVALSAYPNASSYQGNGVPHICKSEFNDEGIPTFQAVIKAPPKPGDPMARVPFAAGGFWFAPRDVVLSAPPVSLRGLFQGEEILQSARLYCGGVDMFAPTRPVFTHSYGRPESPKVWSDLGPQWKKDQKASLRRVKLALGLARPLWPGEARQSKEDAIAWGLRGPAARRSLADFWAYAGLDIYSKRSTSAAKFC